MFRLTIISLSLWLIVAAKSASACNAISDDVAKLGSALNALDHSARLGDVVVCAAEDAVSNDSARKAASLVKINQIEAYLDGSTSPMIHSALEQIKAALIK